MSEYLIDVMQIVLLLYNAPDTCKNCLNLIKTVNFLIEKRSFNCSISPFYNKNNYKIGARHLFNI